MNWPLITIETMKRLLCCFCGLLLATSGLRATVLFSDTFTYPNGNLVAQGGWVQTGASATTPIQVTGGRAVLGTSGQDVNAPVGPFNLVDGSSIYLGATINVTSAQTTGDYFLHWAPSSGSTIFESRTEIRDAGGSGFNVGLIQTASATISWGSGVYSYGQDYRIVVGYNSVTGTLNDTGDVWMNGTHEVAGAVWTPSVNAEPTVLGSINLRQGSATAAPALSIDDLNVATTFAEVAIFTPIPEPTSLSLFGGFGLLAWFLRRRK
jgi:hypothetical protein